MLIIFGPKQLPELGKTMKSIRDGMKDDPSATSDDSAESPDSPK